MWVYGDDGRLYYPCTECGTSGEVYRRGRSFYMDGPDEPTEPCWRCGGRGHLALAPASATSEQAAA